MQNGPSSPYSRTLGISCQRSRQEFGTALVQGGTYDILKMIRRWAASSVTKAFAIPHL